ncbi:hypothetical protein [Burkholderia pseudomallei]|uniref:hypothetical protein n=1 Tax=Burkholderia pseudomallei TaxID=28450 RepID=UPI001AAFD2B7|nr:hypothetical protein [Burkholderia pseudomallei]MBO2980317.1 hypothetical protein [Burkholderia pseudomallei]
MGDRGLRGGHRRTIAHDTAAGIALPSLAALPPGVLPADLAVASSGSLLSVDGGPSQQIDDHAFTSRNYTALVCSSGLRQEFTTPHCSR